MTDSSIPPMTPDISAPSRKLIGKEVTKATRRFADDTPARSWWYLLSTIGLFGAALVATLALPGWPLRMIAGVVTGLLLVRLFVIYHDHQHGAILAKSRAAAWLMEGIGVISVSPTSVWRASHQHHHHHNCALHDDQIGSFPVMSVAEYARASRSERRRYLAHRHPATIFLGYVTIFLFGMCLLPFLRSPRQHLDGLLALMVQLGVAVVLVNSGGVLQLLASQTIPFLVAGALGTYLFYAQHNFPGARFSSAEEWSHERAAMESSSFMRMSPIMLWFTANISYHHIHHLNAKIPFYRLPDVVAAFPELQTTRTTSLRWSDVRDCLRLKLWDEAAQTLVQVPPASELSPCDPELEPETAVAA